MPSDPLTDMRPPQHQSASWSDERQAIGKLLHDGILQDLTVLGFELSSLQRDAPSTMQPKIAELLTWVASRQAALRELVSALADPGHDIK